MSASEYRQVAEALPSQAQFDEALADHRNAAKQIHNLMLHEADVRREIGSLKADREHAEAVHVANGIPGKNAEERAAFLTLALGADEGHTKIVTALGDKERELARTQASLELWKDARSIAKRRAEAFIAVHQAAGRD